MFWPLAQANEGHTTLVVRSQASPADVAPALKRVLTGIDSSFPSLFGNGRMRWRWCFFRRAWLRLPWGYGTAGCLTRRYGGLRDGGVFGVEAAPGTWDSGLHSAPGVGN
jgi:hypothetical protein